VFNPLDWRARGGVSWRTTDWGASLTANYQNEYRDVYALPNRSIDSLVTWDFRASHEFGPERAARISLSIQNLFDEDPPFTNNPIGVGYDPANASPLGRFAVLEVRQSW
jgi:outer membrane receptor protein involved in Fe transport